MGDYLLHVGVEGSGVDGGGGGVDIAGWMREIGIQ